MRLAIDTGGTFTDLVLQEIGAAPRLFKAPTIPSDPVAGVLDVIAAAARARGEIPAAFLAQTELIVHGTTHALNAILTGQTARTAFLTTHGHPDVLVLREGGRRRPFDHAIGYPDPYVPRALTFEIGGRLLPDGSELEPFDEPAARATVHRLRELKVEAAAVCLLWSVVNPAHEIALATLLDELMPDVPYTLSHALNPTLREFRRAASAAIDASLKPLMAQYMRGLEVRLRTAGFAGRLLIVTSRAGLIEAADAARAPIHIVNSGPSMAPVAGGRFAAQIDCTADVIVADAGGTSFDVSLMRRGRVPITREPWVGEQYTGVMVGFPWVDVRSIGAGGGSIAWVDEGGLLHVGPQSAGAVPGPVAYGRGGVRPTVTDAAVVLGHLDPDYFLGGEIRLDRAAAEAAIDRAVAGPLGLSLEQAADAILRLATERMAGAIAGITIDQGVDPKGAVLIGGGGAAGLNIARIAQRLGCARLLLPRSGAALSAAGALLSDLKSEAQAVLPMSTVAFNAQAADDKLTELESRCAAFAVRVGAPPERTRYARRAQARYATQVWDIEVPLPSLSLAAPGGLEAFKAAFHAAHEALFGYSDAGSAIQVLEWTVEVTCALEDALGPVVQEPVSQELPQRARSAYFSESGWTETPVRRLDTLEPHSILAGPALIESALTTIVVPPEMVATMHASGSLLIQSAAKA